MNTSLGKWLSLILVLVAAGCRPAQRAVVVDLDAVAKASGRDVIITRSIETATHQLNSQLVQAAKDMEEEIKQLQAKLGTSPTPQQQAELQRARTQAQQNVQNNKLVAESARNRVRAEQILLFRSEVKPIAAELARQRGAELVLIANEHVVWHAPTADITGDVITRLRAQPLLPEEKPAPAAPATDSGNGNKSTNALGQAQ